MEARFKKMKKLIVLISICLLTGCMNMNMDKQPNRWITVLDADTGEPVPDVPLVYTSIKKPYFIVGAVMISRQYVSDANGKAHVPSGVSLKTKPGSDYIAVPEPTDKKSGEALKGTAIYVKPLEKFMKERY